MHIADPSALERASRLLALVNSGALARTITIAAEFHLADHLATGPKHIDDLARLTGTDPSALRRLLRALVSLDLLGEREDGAFELSATGELLRSDAPCSLHNWVLWQGKYTERLWGKLGDTVRSGESAKRLLNGANDFGYLDDDADAAAVFNGAMSEYTSLVAAEVLRVCDFSRLRRIVDVGGGHGAFVAALLQANPDLQGVLFDRPHAMAGARALLAKAEVAARCEMATGDFFDAVPAGGDGYLLKTIVHDWDDDRGVTILRNCRKAMPRDGRLIVVERVLPDRFEANPRHHAIARADLAMLLALGGRERTAREYAGLFEAAGFELTGVTATATEFSVLEGRPC